MLLSRRAHTLNVREDIFPQTRLAVIPLTTNVGEGGSIRAFMRQDENTTLDKTLDSCSDKQGYGLYKASLKG